MKLKQIFTIARYTMEESIYNKIVQLALLIALGTFAIGYFVTNLMIGSRLKVMLDFSLLSYQIFEFSFIFFFIVPFLSKQERLKTFSIFFIKPIERSSFLAGFFLGFGLILAFFCILFFLFHFFLFWLIFEHWMPHLLLAFIAIFLEALFLASAGLLFSILLPNLLAYVAILATYIVSYTSYDWITIMAKKSNGIKLFFAYSLYYILPDLSMLDIKSFVIYQIPFSAKSFFISALYALSISIFFLICSIKIFIKKNIL